MLDKTLSKLYLSLPKNGDNNVEVTNLAGTNIPEGIYDGGGKAVLSALESAKVIEGNIKDGVTLLGVLGTLKGGLDTSGFTAEAADVLSGKTFGSNAEIEETGSMIDNADNDVEVTDVDGTLIPAGYYNGAGSAVLSAAEAAKVVSGNIKSGVTILGVDGDSNVVDTSSGDAAADEIKTGKKAWVDGAELTGARFPIEDYCQGLREVFSGAELPSSVTIIAPNATKLIQAFFTVSGLQILDLTCSNALSTLLQTFYGSTSIQSITIRNQLSSVTSYSKTFQNCTALHTIAANLDFSSISTGSEVTDTFANCSALENVTVVQNTLGYSISFVSSPLLSNASLVSIVNGCLEGSALTLTMHASSKTIMEALKGDVTGSAGNYLFTINAGGSVDLADFLRDTKGCTLA